jgi:hypothetical protein
MLSRRKFIKQSSLGFGFAMMPTSFNFFELNDFVTQIFKKFSQILPIIIYLISRICEKNLFLIFSFISFETVFLFSKNKTNSRK